MQAVILAAGRGERLRPFTDRTPKPMLEVGGQPILAYTLRILPAAVEQIILVVGYKGQQIKRYFSRHFSGRPLQYIDQPEQKGTGQALLLAKPSLENKPFLVLFGDDLYHYRDLQLCAKHPGPTLLVHETQNPERFGVCLLDKKGCLKALLEKQENPPSNLVNIGVYKLDHRIFKVPAVQLASGEYNLPAQIGQWAKITKVKALKASFWHPINMPQDLTAAQQIIKFLQPNRND